MPKRRREAVEEHAGGKRKKRRKYEALLRRLNRLRREITSSSSEDSLDKGGCYTDSDEALSRKENERPREVVAAVEDRPETPEVAEEANEKETEETAPFEFLGAKPKPVKTVTEPLHEELAARWNIYLQDGVQKEIREKILNKYPLFENCPLLSTPLLGPEISSCLDQKALRHDKFMSIIQDQTGHALAALGCQMNLFLKNPENHRETLTTLADVGQLIANVHQAVSTHRKYNIVPFLNYSSRKLLETCKTDNYLLGKNFVTEVKASETARKTSLELKVKPPVKATKPQTSYYGPAPEGRPQVSSYPNRSLNWKRPVQHVRKKQPTRGRGERGEKRLQSKQYPNRRF